MGPEDCAYCRSGCDH